MNGLSSYPKKPRHIWSGSWEALTRLFASCCCRGLLSVSPFLTNIFYFVVLSLLGFGILKSLNPRTTFTPRNIDLFFTSISATTVSSMSTVEMEVFSNSQLIVMTVLMFLGGEVLISVVGIHLRSLKIRTTRDAVMKKVGSVQGDQVESQQDVLSTTPDPFLKHVDSIKFLGFVGLGYLLVTHVVGIVSVLLYLSLIQTAQDVLTTKGLNKVTFAIFTIVSTFTNCGFIPTNENMVVFRKNSGFLWILTLEILLGNTLFPSALSFVLWVLSKIFKETEAKYLLQNPKEIGYAHLLPSLHSTLLAVTVTGFVLIGFIMFCSMEWHSSALSGMNTYQKVVGALFQSVSARHAGETIVDLSTIAPAILVFFVFMMYLPPYTLFLPIKRAQESEQSEKGRECMVKNLMFSQLTYVVISIILICITERKSLKDDPINFSVLNITIEVVSAYGNVGFTTGYSCERRLTPDPSCVNKSYGFSGKWSDGGKVILIIVMFFGRLKKFSKNGGRAWKLF